MNTIWMEYTQYLRLRGGSLSCIVYVKSQCTVMLNVWCLWVMYMYHAHICYIPRWLAMVAWTIIGNGNVMRSHERTTIQLNCNYKIDLLHRVLAGIWLRTDCVCIYMWSRFFEVEKLAIFDGDRMFQYNMNGAWTCFFPNTSLQDYNNEYLNIQLYSIGNFRSL